MATAKAGVCTPLRVGAPHRTAQGPSPLRVGAPGSGSAGQHCPLARHQRVAALHRHSHHPVALDKVVARGVDVRVEDSLGQHLENLGRLLAVGAQSLG